MKLSIKNLGIVNSAEIDLSKDLTIFCGPNGTGKTYVAYLLNALFNLKTDIIFPVNSDSKEDLLKNNRIQIKYDYLPIWIEQIENKLKSQLPSIFGISPKVANNMFLSTEIKLIVEEKDKLEIFESEKKYFYIQKLNSSLKFIHAEKNKKDNSIHFSGELDKTNANVAYQKIISDNISYIFKWILLSRKGSRMLTVERNSIYTFKTELLANRIETVDNVLIYDNEDAGEIIRQRATLYPQAVRNSLKVANELPEIIKIDSIYNDFASDIESQLLSGSVSVGKDGDVRFMPNSDSESHSLSLPIQMSSSSVKTLSGLVVYLRHLAQKGEVLIIDEPEMNLHPDNQRRLARIFARMVNNGIRLVISTHSDYIIRELNILLMYKALLSKNYEVETYYSESEAIDKEMFQGYLFDFNKNQKVNATPITIDDFGIEVSTIDKSIEDQNEQTLIFRDSLDEIE